MFSDWWFGDFWMNLQEFKVSQYASLSLCLPLCPHAVTPSLSLPLSLTHTRHTHSTNISGYLPEVYSAHRFLRRFDVSYTPIQGPVPGSFGLLDTLQVFLASVFGLCLFCLCAACAVKFVLDSGS